MKIDTKKALIVSPYLDHLGGGERYMLSIASALESLNYQVTFSWDNIEEINKLAAMLGITLQDPAIDQRVMSLYHSKNPMAMYLASRRYDLTVYLSDGSLPLLGSRKNLIHMQVPFHNVGGNSFKNKFKKRFFNDIIVNSQFTKKIIDQEFGVNSTVLYPPVQLVEVKKAKEKIILSVGRFEPSLNTKKQDILIEAFRIFSPKFPEWKLVLAGASTSDEWINRLREMAVGLPIEFAINATHGDLNDLYARSTVYWHAAGYGINEAKNPELTEHFGISCVEAISAGCAPFVVGKGGQPEIVSDISYHWETPSDLAIKTAAWINSPRAIPTFATDYSLKAFTNQLSTLLQKI
ncbi:MAG: glycosyltransferase family 4 protein [bacterium]